MELGSNLALVHIVQMNAALGKMMQPKKNELKDGGKQLPRKEIS